MFQKIDPYSVILHKILKVPTPFVSKLYNVPNISWPVVDMCVCVLSIIQLHQSLLNQHITHCYNSYTTHTWCSKIIPSISLKQSGIGEFSVTPCVQSASSSGPQLPLNKQCTHPIPWPCEGGEHALKGKCFFKTFTFLCGCFTICIYYSVFCFNREIY